MADYGLDELQEFFKKPKNRKVKTTTIKSLTEIDQFYINRKEANFRPDYCLTVQRRSLGCNKKSYKIASKTMFNDFEGI